MTRLTRRGALALLTAGVAAGPARAKYGEPVYLDGRGHAIRGYDPVAFFTFEEATLGSLDHALETPEGTWLFARADHLSKFRAAPQKYLPQFGGYCAQGVASGFKRISDPTLWVLIDGKIYLHYSIPEQNRWAGDIRGNIALGEEKWPALRDL